MDVTSEPNLSVIRNHMEGKFRVMFTGKLVSAKGGLNGDPRRNSEYLQGPPPPAPCS